MASSHPSASGSGAGDVAGEPLGLKTSLLDKGAGLLQGITQNLRPISNVHQHLCAFHMYAHDLSRQVEAHHFCSHLNEDVQQCIIYDSDRTDARLLGIEYVVQESIFEKLPPEEKKLWHSHEFEVKSGTLILPGLPGLASRPVLAKLAKTYGKTWHFWQPERGDTLPLGVPQLMLSATADGQLDPAMVEARDRRHGVDSAQLREERKDLEGPKHDPRSDYPMRTGRGLKVVLKEVPVHVPALGSD